MAFLEINGYELPPCKRGVSIIVTTIVNSGRDANGAVAVSYTHLTLPTNSLV